MRSWNVSASKINSLIDKLIINNIIFVPGLVSNRHRRSHNTKHNVGWRKIWPVSLIRTSFKKF